MLVGSMYPSCSVRLFDCSVIYTRQTLTILSQVEQWQVVYCRVVRVLFDLNAVVSRPWLSQRPFHHTPEINICSNCYRTTESQYVSKP